MSQDSAPSASSNQQACSQPTLFHDRSFWGMISTQFLGAFNDNLYKQLMLLLAVPVVLSGTVGEFGETGEGQDVQGWAGLVFALPFVLFSGFAGFLSDRFSKTPIIVYCKVAEIVIMLLGLGAFYYYGLLGQTGTWIVLFLMGTQSAFFGPGKYGVLPELFQEKDLPRANGLILMTTFMAIILGIVSAGVLKEWLAKDSTEDLWMGLFCCVLVAIVGTATSLLVRTTPPAQPRMKLTADCWGVSAEIMTLLRRDPTLLGAVVVSSIFWLVSGLAVPTVNRLGLEQLGVGEFQTSILTACVGLGIMPGALLASLICRRGWGDVSVNLGLGGIFLALLALGFWTGAGHTLGYKGSLVALLLLGVFAAVFSIPIQVFLQSRPPANLKGRMIATMNQANFIGILISGPLYQLYESIASWMNWPISSVFWMMGILVLPIALFYRLNSMAGLHPAQPESTKLEAGS